MQSAFKKLRYFVDNIDSLIMKLLSKRIRISKKIQALKPSPVKFSPAREKEILKNCPKESLDVYLTILAVSRSWPAEAEWFFISSGDAERDELAMLYFRKIFGFSIKIAMNPDVDLLAKSAADSSGKKTLFVICPGPSRLAGRTKGFFFKHADYKKGGRKVLEFYSTSAPADEKSVTITL